MGRLSVAVLYMMQLPQSASISAVGKVTRSAWQLGWSNCMDASHISVAAIRMMMANQQTLEESRQTSCTALRVGVRQRNQGHSPKYHSDHPLWERL